MLSINERIAVVVLVALVVVDIAPGWPTCKVCGLQYRSLNSTQDVEACMYKTPAELCGISRLYPRMLRVVMHNLKVS